MKSADPRIDPFAVLSNEQIEQVLRAAEGIGHASPWQPRGRGKRMP